MAKKISKKKTSDLAKKAKVAAVYSCADIKAAIAKEIRTQVKEKDLRERLVEKLGVEVAYNVGGGPIAVVR